MVRLVEEEGGAGGGGLRDGGLLDIGEGFGAVDLGLARSEEVQVGAVEEEDFFGCHFVCGL